MKIHAKIKVCEDCVLFIANGDTPGETAEDGDVFVARLESRWGENLRNMCLCGLDGESFSWALCGGCGSSRGGIRQSAVILCDHAECE